jgi:hypothetical protein
MENRLAEFGVTGFVILAWLLLWSFVLRTIQRHNADKPFAQGLSNLI